MRLRHVAFGVAAFLVATIAAAGSAHAASITFQIDCNIVGGSPDSCDPIAPIGTIKIVDSLVNTDLVRITVALTSGGDLQQFFLNFEGSVPSGYAFQTTTTGVTYDPDDVKADGYGSALFDLNIPDKSTLGVNPYVTFLRLTNGTTTLNLNATDFDLFTGGPGPGPALLAAIQVTGGGSYFGSQHFALNPDEFDVDPPPAFVPEPASLTLLGTGLIATMARLRRRARKP